jgi:hypothetical protein
VHHLESIAAFSETGAENTLISKLAIGFESTLFTYISDNSRDFGFIIYRW